MRIPFALPLAALAALALSACAGPDAGSPSDPPAASTPSTSPPPESAMPDDPATPPPADGLAESCDAEAARRFVGQAATEAVVEQARAAAGARSARTLKPGQVVTMEYRAGRLNLDVDADGVITDVRCG